MNDFYGNNTRNLNADLFGPQGTENVDPESFFHASQQFKKQKCRWGFVKCCGGMAICIALNAVSFYLGVQYAMNDENSSHSAHSSHSN
tara:strand:+ start:1116 stop:1379 length:264 start_codon:yes stop_codon:yes gene_type:complete